jgi:hypothetical protein
VSFKALNWARELKLRGSQKPVLSTLAAYADEEGSCYPGQDLIANDTGFSVRTVRRCLEHLEHQGLIHREARYDRRGHRTSDRYYLHLDITVLPDPAEVAAGVEAAPDDDEPDAPEALDVAPDQADVPPVDNSPTGQIDRRSSCPDLPANLSTTTGHGDRLLDEPSGEQSEEPSGGASALPLSPTCGEHPLGTTAPCRACGDARRAHDAWRAQVAAAAAAPKPSRYDPAIYCPHLQLRSGDCGACEQEARRELELQFGGVA